jgi:hypothetical protein
MSEIIDVQALESKASRGNAEAQFALGLVYFTGSSVTKDYSEAARWFTAAAEKGHAKAQFNLGVMYSSGIGVVQNYVVAASWFLRSADAGYAKAMCNLGVMFNSGHGVLADRVEAYKWFALAAAQNNQQASQAMETLEPTLTPKEMTEAQVRIMGFSPRKSVT